MKTNECSIVGCDKPAFCKGFCIGHYARHRKYQDAEYGGPLRGRGGRIYPEKCAVDGCDGKHSAKGFCAKHYQASKTHGDPLYRRAIRTCTVAGCERPHKGFGFCDPHLDRHRRYGSDQSKWPPIREFQDPLCTVPGCSNKSDARGMCNKHYARWRNNGDPNKVAWIPNSPEKREWHIDHVGRYIIRYEPGNPMAIPNGIVYQHRHVMSQMLGRPLREGENVHHRNGDRTDNRPENLELWLSGQPAGQRVQDRMRWHLEQINEHFGAALALDDDKGSLLGLARKTSKILKGENPCAICMTISIPPSRMS